MVWVIVVGVAAALLAAYFIASSLGASSFRARYDKERADLLARAVPMGAEGSQPLESLPPPVRRYLEVTGVEGRPAPKVAILKQRGTLRTGPDKPWMPFEAEQAYSFDPPGFVWIADARPSPILHILARDKFVDGKGNMLITLLGLATVADAWGPEMDLGAGLRHWGEIVAFPEAVRSRYLRWEPRDERNARLVIEQGPLKMNAVIEFGEDGLLVGMHAERYREAQGKYVLTPWSGRCLDWRKVDGRLFPTRWESTWHTPEGDFNGVRIEILGVDVAF